MSPATPAAEVEIDEELVRALLRDQHPPLDSLPLERIDSGWDNTMFRLGEELCVRLPRRQAAAELVVNEQRWLPVLASRLPVPVPAPRQVGRPGRGFPWRWSVVPWLEGVTADREPLDADQAGALGAFLAALHAPAPPEAPRNPFRGVPLEARAAAVAERTQRLRADTAVVPREIESIWERALAAPPSTQACWLHGDLHPRNVLVDGGRLCGIIDWGDLTAGDVATDLASVWMLFADSDARGAAIADYSARSAASEDVLVATLARAGGWAVFFGLVLLDLVDDPRHAASGAATLARVSEDFG
jgi:aminoglycoside phosphotransferase (APT) family kinase protein